MWVRSESQGKGNGRILPVRVVRGQHMAPQTAVRVPRAGGGGGGSQSVGQQLCSRIWGGVSSIWASWRLWEPPSGLLTHAFLSCSVRFVLCLIFLYNKEFWLKYFQFPRQLDAFSTSEASEPQNPKWKCLIPYAFYCDLHTHCLIIGSFDVFLEYVG